MFSYAQANAVASVSINSDEDVVNEQQQKQSVTSQDQHKRQTLIQMHR